MSKNSLAGNIVATHLISSVTGDGKPLLLYYLCLNLFQGIRELADAIEARRGKMDVFVMVGLFRDVRKKENVFLSLSFFVFRFLLLFLTFVNFFEL